MGPPGGGHAVKKTPIFRIIAENERAGRKCNKHIARCEMDDNIFYHS